MKKLITTLLSVFLFCTLYAQSYPQFIEVPFRYRSLTYIDDSGLTTQIEFRGPKSNDKKSAEYVIKKGAAITVMTGSLRMTANSNKLYLEYPSTIDNSDPEYIADLLKKIFPYKSTAILEWNPDYVNLESCKKGAYVINNISFTDYGKSNQLEWFTLDGYKIKYSKQFWVVNEDTWFYEKPDFSSKKIPVVKNPLGKSIYAANRKVFNHKLEIKEKDISLPAIKGISFYTRAVYYANTAQTDRWFYARIDDFADAKYGWIHASKLTNACAPALFETLAAKFQDEGAVRIFDEDTSSLPSEMNCIDIEPEEETYLYYDDKYIWFTNEWTGIYTKLPRSCFMIDQDGYLKIKYKNFSMLFITGGINQLFKNFKNDGENTYDDPERDSGYHNYNIKSITASSYFQEKIKGRLIKYTPDNLGKTFEIGCKCHPYWWNYSHIPWVEGVEGNGIGEYITIEFIKPMVELELINGYSDINNMKLFKENARIKTFKLEDLDNNLEQTVFFEDYVYFNKVLLKKPTSKIRLTIEEVYPGTKYQDTCFSGILASERPRYSDDLKENAENFKKFYSYALEISPEEYFGIR